MLTVHEGYPANPSLHHFNPPGWLYGGENAEK